MLQLYFSFYIKDLTNWDILNGSNLNSLIGTCFDGDNWKSSQNFYSVTLQGLDIMQEVTFRAR